MHIYKIEQNPETKQELQKLVDRIIFDQILEEFKTYFYAKYCPASERNQNEQD